MSVLSKAFDKGTNTARSRTTQNVAAGGTLTFLVITWLNGLVPEPYRLGPELMAALAGVLGSIISRLIAFARDRSKLKRSTGVMLALCLGLTGMFGTGCRTVPSDNGGTQLVVDWVQVQTGATVALQVAQQAWELNQQWRAAREAEQANTPTRAQRMQETLQQISDFLAANPQLTDLFDLGTKTLPPPSRPGPEG